MLAPVPWRLVAQLVRARWAQGGPMRSEREVVRGRPGPQLARREMLRAIRRDAGM